jgi:hypothetical protein
LSKKKESTFGFGDEGYLQVTDFGLTKTFSTQHTFVQLGILHQNIYKNKT